MKYLEDERLNRLNALLSERLEGRIEAYTMKRGQSDKKYAKVFSDQLNQNIRKRSISVGEAEEAQIKHGRQFRSLSFDDNNKVDLGDLYEPSTQRLLTDLILTLNASLPDYDFGAVQPDHFIKETMPNAIRNINAKLDGIIMVEELWRACDAVIELHDCDIYRFAYDYDDQPSLWTIVYFFVNKNKKRIVLLHCAEHIDDDNDLSINNEPFEKEKTIKETETSMDYDFDLAAAPAGGLPLSL